MREREKRVRERVKEREREIERKREAGSEGGRWGRKNFDPKAAAAVFLHFAKRGPTFDISKLLWQHFRAG